MADYKHHAVCGVVGGVGAYVFHKYYYFGTEGASCETAADEDLKLPIINKDPDSEKDKGSEDQKDETEDQEKGEEEKEDKEVVFIWPYGKFALFLAWYWL